MIRAPRFQACRGIRFRLVSISANDFHRSSSLRVEGRHVLQERLRHEQDRTQIWPYKQQVTHKLLIRPRLSPVEQLGYGLRVASRECELQRPSPALTVHSHPQ